MPEMREEAKQYIKQINIPYSIGGRDGKLHVIRTLDAPNVPRCLVPRAVLNLERDYLDGKIKRMEDRGKWRRARQLLRRYRLLPPKETTRAFDYAPSKVDWEKRRAKSREYSRAYRRGNPGYGVPRVPSD